MAQQVVERPIFRKDFSIFRRSVSGQSVPSGQSVRASSPPAPRRKRQPVPPIPAKKTRHATLILLREHNLSQAPDEYWHNVRVDEAVAIRSERNSKCAFFDRDNDAQVHVDGDRREINQRRRERDERSKQADWLLGPAQQVPMVLMEMEDVQQGIRTAAFWGNTGLQARESRGNVDSNGVWFNRAADEEEQRIKREIDTALREIRPMSWTGQVSRPSSTAAAASASVRNSTASIPEKRASDSFRSSIFSSMTRATTPRSSVLSSSLPSSTPPTSGYPSPALSTDSTKGFWNRPAHPPSPDDESPGGFKLPPPITETPAPPPPALPAPAKAPAAAGHAPTKSWGWWSVKQS